MGIKINFPTNFSSQKREGKGDKTENDVAEFWELAAGDYPTIAVLIQEIYSGCGLSLYINSCAGFLKQLDEGIIIVAAKADKPFYLGIHQHLGA